MTDPLGDDALVALALDDVEPAERARLSDHLAGCPSCRAEYAVIEDAVQRAMVATPAIAPPPGFSGRVLAAMGTVVGATPAPIPPAPAPTPLTARRWWTPLVAAAALVVGLALGVGGTLALTPPPAPAAPGATAAPPATAAPAATAATAASALVTRAGEAVGTAGVTTLAGRSYLVVTITRARPGMAYECVLVGPDGRRSSGGTWTLDARSPGAEASGTWVVEVPAGGVEQVELVAPSGAVWSRAQF